MAPHFACATVPFVGAPVPFIEQEPPSEGLDQCHVNMPRSCRQLAAHAAEELKSPLAPCATSHLKSPEGAILQSYVAAGGGVGALAQVKLPVAMLHLQLRGPWRTANWMPSKLPGEQ